jgi:histidyl-tRNA synthetase
MDQINPVNKLFYIGSLFRQEKPQKGRLRQFNQFGMEVIGSPNPEADAEVIRLMYDIFTDLGITQMDVKINSIGGRESRLAYLKTLEEALKPHYQKLCPTCQTRFHKNILRIFDCKNEGCQQILDDHAPAIIDHLNDEDRQHFEDIKKYLDITQTPYTIEKKLVRGLDYYTKTTFEISSSLLGSQDAICGGGRYDHLVEDLGARPTPAVGVACGMERLLMVLEELEVFQDNTNSIVPFVSLGEKAIECAFELITKCRQNNIPSEMDFMRRSMKAQMRNAGKSNARYVVIIGDREVEENQVMMKDMEKGEQRKIAFDDLIDTLKEII